jgi:predicted amidophosphoribosyltransferase
MRVRNHAAVDQKRHEGGDRYQHNPDRQRALFVVLGVLIAFAWALRRRPDDLTARRAVEAALDVVESGSRVPIVSDGAVAVQPSAIRRVCPSCRRDYAGSLRYCPRDARRLVAASELVETRSALPREKSRTGSVCPACKRSYDRALRFCPHDAAELVPGALYAVTEVAEFDVVGDQAKICPQCRRRHDLAATFCSRDGAELVVLN